MLEDTYQALEDAKDRLRRISGRRLSNDKLILSALESLEAATSATRSTADSLMQGMKQADINAVLAERLRELAQEIEHGRKRAERGETLAWRRTLTRSLHSGSPGPAQDLLLICRQTLLSD